MQQTIVNILGADAPDVQRLIDTGLAGQKVLLWVADALPRLTEEGAHVPLVTPGDPITVTAGLWLQAAGLDETLRQAA
jgi:hypothetical protein